MKAINKKIGIIGGGQLGKMMILDAKRLGFHCTTLDPTLHCPSHSISDEHIISAFDDRDALRALAEQVDVITYEFEHIDAEFLSVLEDEGYTIYPSPKALLLIQDKLLQKQELQKADIPIPDFSSVSNLSELESYLKANHNKGMLKSRTGGYDGKGNALIQTLSEAEKAYNDLGAGEIPLMIESFVPFTKEISVLACRTINGDTEIYPVGENHHKDSILDETIVPARIHDNAYKEALKISEQVMEIFEGVGMFCIELFVTTDHQVLVNEVAPRPHNSGHYTIEGCYTSQFEQHIRSITGLPLGSSRLMMPTVMKNLLGEPEYSGTTVIEGLTEVYRDPDVKVHLYGKSETKPKRKMGHITVCANHVDLALQKARNAFELIKIISE